MDGFTYMSMVSRIEHYEQIARRMAKEAREPKAGRRDPAAEPAKLATTSRPGNPVQLLAEKSA